MTKERFIGLATSQLIEKGFSVKLLNQKKLYDGSAGLFYEDKKQLVCAFNHEDWFEIFVHEFGHFLQLTQNKKLWNELGSHYDLFEEFLEGRKLDTKTAKKALQGSIKLELLCERKVLSLIRKYKLPISREGYCQRANYYLLSYLFRFLIHDKDIRFKYDKSTVEQMPKTLKTLKFYLTEDNLPEQFLKYL